jgi:hypothetical protein
VNIKINFFPEMNTGKHRKKTGDTKQEPQKSEKMQIP